MSSVEIFSRPELSFLRQSNDLLMVTVCQYLEKTPTNNPVLHYQKIIAFDGVDRYEIPNSSWSVEKDGMPSLSVGGEEGNSLDEIPPQWLISFLARFVPFAVGQRKVMSRLPCLLQNNPFGFCLSPRFQHTSSEVQRPTCIFTLPHRTAWESYYWQ